MRDNTLYYLRIAQRIKISNRCYKIIGILEFQQRHFYWKEYHLEDEETKSVSWLNVEKDQKKSNCMLFHLLPKGSFSENTPEYEGNHYELLEDGIATVVSADNIPDTQSGDLVHYQDYHCVTDNGLLLSREVWNNETEYSAGKSIPKAEIGFDPNEAYLTIHDESINEELYQKLSHLSLGQYLSIKGKSYSVVGMVEYRQGHFKWKEYKLKNSEKTVWFCVEKEGEEYLLSLHHEIPYYAINESQVTHSYNNITYKRVERGSGVVESYSGNVDFDPGERFVFTEYESEDGTKFFSVETWGTEKEISYGYTVRPQDVQVLKKRNYFAMPLTKVILAITGIFLIWLAVTAINEGYLQPKVEEKIKDNTKTYSYVTSVTLSDGTSKKANIYKTAMSVQETYRHLMKLEPNHLKKIGSAQMTDPNEQPDIFLETAREELLIYESEDGSTYIQIAPIAKTAGQLSAAPYRSRYRDRSRIFYNNARQDSINSRRSSGGGTSFGK